VKKREQLAMDQFVEEEQGHCTRCFGFLFRKASRSPGKQRAFLMPRPPAVTRGISPPAESRSTDQAATSQLQKMLDQKSIMFARARLPDEIAK
jgi:hypothetical protein